MKNKFRWIGKTDRQVTLNQIDDVVLPKYDKSVTIDKTFIFAIIDIETTGLNHNIDEIIELAIILLRVDEHGKIIEILQEFNELNEPLSLKISDFITGKTGITNEMVAGKKIDWDVVNDIIKLADGCVSFNAAFDRPFLDLKVESCTKRPWADAYTQIPWESYNYPKINLEALCYYHGFFYEAHRAIADVKALINLLQNNEPILEASNYFNILLSEIVKNSYVIIAKKTPFSKKDFLTNNKMSWNKDLLLWYKFSYNIDEIKAIETDLLFNVYENNQVNLDVVELNASERFKDIETYVKEGLVGSKTYNKFNKPLVIVAQKTPYSTRKKLYDRDYDWSNLRKYWYKYIGEEDLDNEKEWLANEVYPSKSFDGKVLKNSYYNLDEKKNGKK
jgi:DNA polymerase-3 subunit epsilon